MTRLTLLLLVLLSFSPSSQLAEEVQSAESDPFLWMESQTPRTEQWVSEQNAQVEKFISSTPEFKKMYANAMAHRSTGSSYPVPIVAGEYIYNLYQDKQQPLGLLRRSPQSAYLDGKPDWEAILDIDLLSKQENIRWDFEALDCLLPEAIRCFIGLASGGIDDVNYREFDTQKKQFIQDGYPPFVSKSAPKWLDADHIYVGLTQEADSVTEHGFAANIKLWQRNTPKEQASIIHQVSTTDLGLFIYELEGTGSAVLASHYKTFHDFGYLLLAGERSYPIVSDGGSQVYGVFDGSVVAKLGADYENYGKHYQAGSVVAIALTSIKSGKPKFELITQETDEYPIEKVSVTQNSILIQRLVDVKSEATLITKDSDGKFQSNKVMLPTNGVIKPLAALYKSDEHLVSYESLVHPATLYRVSAKQIEGKKLYQQDSLLNPALFLTEQHFATSKDGTKIPYFMVYPKAMKFDGKNVTQIRAYGGFGISSLPVYRSSMTAWLDTGGVLIRANVRGGGEYGEKWHKTAIKENKHKSFEDLIAIAEDLIARKVTSPRHLGLFGISNGGLVVSGAATQRPDMFGAVVAGAPLIDMLRYHVLGDGSPYIDEYGNPDTDSDRAYISQYSPYHNIRGEEQPAWFFITSSNDRRVHPAHARKMAARLQSLGHEAMFYEFAEGGHASATGFDERAFRDTLVSCFMHQQLTLTP